ncbi:MAG: GNAT family N-acetyltransferase [Candidatus Lambdaproteobacteria bacterium]|nr:GNAT family N-acetyltransferase [Candidatus Lambdaproteobacteria bacterium]
MRAVTLNLAIRPAYEADLGEIDRIEHAAFATPWSRQLLEGAISNRQYEVRVLASRFGIVRGFSIAHLEGAVSNLDNLAVDEPVRNRGYGRQLLEDWIARGRLRQLRALTLQVNTANVDAQRLYRRYAFAISRRLPGYYPNGDDAFEMETALPRPHRSWRARLLGKSLPDGSTPGPD